MSRTELVRRVDSLTAAQKARLAEYRDRWIAIGLRTGPADRKAFERHVARCYQAADLQPPKRVVWVTSPFVLAFAAPAAALAIEWRKAIERDPRVAEHLLSGIDHPAVGTAVRTAVHTAVGTAVRTAVGTSVDTAVGTAVRTAVGTAVGTAVDTAVGTSVDTAVHTAVDTAVGTAVGTSPIAEHVVNAIQRSYYSYIGGQLWAGYGWSYYGSPGNVSFLREVCGLTLGEEMDARATAYAGTVESACWWWPHRDFVMVCERPTHIDRDAQGRLHSLERKAIEWPDGWGLYRINGTEVPADVIEHPERITVEAIDAEQNDEVRRIMVERYGSERFIADAGAEKIQEDEYGALYVRKFKTGPPAVFVHLVNSTPEVDGTRREFWRRVHPELRPLLGGGQLGEPQKFTAHNAVASTFGLRGDQYAPLMQT